ncbi:MAG: alanine:cation symporter family protein [Acidobacteria bacterium]|nr:MAG: alanine:cation symporter family protein [Acidobacteriota bacterium]REK02893.1 MAG: alanine:cation symporter family protein [Acidobacteriota bacterium]REK13303.1 MAG: alanine:cation symporter family protein [Acidobacteriota bacterium]REK41297.1 MAG: alanine:cation symporter family protein [Acidobacteriota bacterium]
MTNHKVLKYFWTGLFALLLPIASFAAEAAQTTAEKGLDERINDAFDPIASTWEWLILYPIPIMGFDIPIVLILLVFGATFFTLYFGFINIRGFPLALRVVRGKYDEIEQGGDPITTESVPTVEGDIPDTIRQEGVAGEVNHFQALATAVSGTVGLGNIAGVAVAIAVGGPGATFWMIIAGLLGMSSKFVECTLGVKYRDLEPDGTVYGGPMYYLSKGLAEKGLAPVGKVLAIIFALFCVGGSLGGGNAFQANQATAQLTSMMGLQGGAVKTIIGIILAVFVGLVIIGGIKRIAKVTEKVVPFMAVLYVVAALIIIFSHFSFIPQAFMLIINGAFTPEAGLGGIAGVIIQGFRRAAFSNEAGAGSAAIAHSAVNTKYPASEGIVALLEPFIDTVVICTMTALVIIMFNSEELFVYSAQNLQGVQIAGETVGGVDLTSRAFDDVLPGFRYILTIAILLFAFSTMISWSYYGLQSWKYLFGRSNAADITFKVLFLLFVVIGAAAQLDAVIKFSDAMILALVFPNMVGLLFLFPKVKDELTKYLAAIKGA